MMETIMKKYARYNNVIGIIVDDNVTKTQIAIKMGSRNVKILVDKDKVKTANTPQELLKINDAIFVKCWNNKAQYTGISKFFIEDNHSLNLWKKWLSRTKEQSKQDRENNYFHRVAKILTPNSNDGYDKQWEAE